MKTKQKAGFRYDGFTGINGTIVPDDLFDVLAPQLGEAELRVLLYIVRRTFGFKKSSDSISLSQLVKGIVTRDGRVLDRGAGVVKSAAVRAVQSLADKGVIAATRQGTAERGFQATVYSLRFRAEPPASTRERGGPLKGQGVVLQEDRQQTVRQQTESINAVQVGLGGKPRRRESLPPTSLGKDPGYLDYLVGEIIKVCGDERSRRYYTLLADRMPDSQLFQFLSEIKADGGARNRGAVFVTKVKDYVQVHPTPEVYEG